jgi:hypothetical protein
VDKLGPKYTKIYQQKPSKEGKKKKKGEEENHEN